MSNDRGSHPSSARAAGEALAPEWKKILYAPERVERWVRGEVSLEELSEVSGPEMLEMAELGFQLYEQDRLAEARAVFEGLAAMDPKEPYYRTALGAVALAQGDLEAAEGLLSEAIRLDDRELASFVNRGEVYLRQGRILEAAADFRRALELDPHERDPLAERARRLAATALQTLREGETEERARGRSSREAAAQ